MCVGMQPDNTLVPLLSWPGLLSRRTLYISSYTVKETALSKLESNICISCTRQKEMRTEEMVLIRAKR